MHLEGLATEFLPAVSPGQSCMSLARLESWRMGPSIRKASVRGMTAVKKKWSLGEEWFCSVMLLWHDLPNIPHNHNVYIAKKCSEILECLPVLCVLLIEHHWTSKILEWNSTRTQIMEGTSSMWKWSSIRLFASRRKARDWNPMIFNQDSRKPVAWTR